MAHYVPIPKDLNDIKEKFIMGFTKRQVICFGIGLVLGAPVYFLTRASIGMSGAIFAMGAVAAPAILYRKTDRIRQNQEEAERCRKKRLTALPIYNSITFGVSALEYKRRSQWALEREMPKEVITAARLRLSWASLPLSYQKRRKRYSPQEWRRSGVKTEVRILCRTRSRSCVCIRTVCVRSARISFL